MKISSIVISFLAAFIFTGCFFDTSADVASRNLSKDAEMFKIQRRIVFYNGITGQYILVISGKCSIDDNKKHLSVTCKTGPAEFKKHFLGLSDNVTYFAEQLESQNVSEFHYKVIFKPTAIVPDIELSN